MLMMIADIYTSTHTLNARHALRALRAFRVCVYA